MERLRPGVDRSRSKLIDRGSECPVYTFIPFYVAILKRPVISNAMRREFASNAPSFEQAVATLRRQSIARGGDGTLRDVECFLCEDGRSAVLYADWSSDNPAVAGFRLPSPTTEAKFNPDFSVARALAEAAKRCPTQ